MTPPAEVLYDELREEGLSHEMAEREIVHREILSYMFNRE